MDDFYDRFCNYNKRDMEILYDRNATSDNMHEVFNRFASECDVAVLLVNARFTDPESYANQVELPVLYERQKAKEVVLVGIRFSNVSDLEEWNAKGDVYFLSVTNNDLPFTRDKKSDDRVFLRKFAVYRQIDEKDLDDFHDRLRQWVKKCIKDKFETKKPAPDGLASSSNKSTSLRSQEHTELILNKLSGFYYNIEKTLSMTDDIWKGNPPSPQDSGRSYGAVFFSRQADNLGRIHKGLDSLSPEDAFFTDRLYRFMPEIEESMNDCRLLIEVSDVGEIPLRTSLSETERYIDKAKKNLLLKSDLRAREELKNFNFPTLKHHLMQLIKRIDDLKNDFEHMNTPTD